MGHVFISYSHKDSEYIEKLEKKLVEEGFNVWIDHRIDYGSQWPKAIEKAVDTCDAYIVVMSENAYDSVWVQREVIHAEKRKKPFFPLLLQGEAWFSLGDIQYVNVTDASLPPKNFYIRLDRAITRKKIITITSPNLEETSDEWVDVEGDNGNQDNKIMLINHILGHQCYLQPDVATPASDGTWNARTHLSPLSVGKDRFIYAISILPSFVEQVQKIFGTKILDITDLENQLQASNIVYEISKGKKLVKIPNTRLIQFPPNKQTYKNNMKDGPRLHDEKAIYFGTYKTVKFSEGDRGKMLCISVNSTSDKSSLWIELWRGAIDGDDYKTWANNRVQIVRSSKQEKPSLSWAIKGGEYTIYIVADSKYEYPISTEKIKYFDISYTIEIL